MPRITQVSIKGFQAHVNSTFSFSPGLTVITGPTDAGKTAVIRALRWVAFNEPEGEGFLTKVENGVQADTAEVTIEFDNGVRITKTRRKGKTSYRHSDYMEPWEKSEVPQEIKEALGLFKQTYGDKFETCLNFAYQLEAPFLLSETGSVGAKILGKLAGTEVVDKAIAATSKSMYKTREELRQVDKEIGEKDVELLEYIEVDNLLKQVEACETLLELIKGNAEKVEKLKGLLGGYAAAVETLEVLNKKLEGFGQIENALVMQRFVEDGNKRLEELKNLVSDYCKHMAVISNCDAELKKYKEIDDATQLLDEVSKNSDRLNLLKTCGSTFLNLTQTIISADTTLSNTKELDKAAHMLGTTDKDIAKLTLLKNLTDSYLNVDAVAKDREEYLKQFTEVGQASSRLEDLKKDIDRLERLQQLEDKYWLKNNVYNVKVLDLTAAAEELEQAEKELKEAWEAAGGICPLCEKVV